MSIGTRLLQCMTAVFYLTSTNRLLRNNPHQINKYKSQGEDQDVSRLVC